MSNRFKRGFTLIEIVFVIVILGIVSSIVVSYAKPNDKGAYNDGSGVFHQATGRYLEAAVQVLGHIRYVQHIAMVDNKFDTADSTWFKENWQIFFANNADSQLQYSIYSDTDKDGVVDNSEVASDPASTERSLTDNVSSSVNNTKLNLYKSYGIKDISFKGGCAVALGNPDKLRISFDSYGRPYKDNITNSSTPFKKTFLIRSTCEIIFSDTTCTDVSCSNASNVVKLELEPETGYVHIKKSF